MGIIGDWLELPVWQQLLALAGFYAASGGLLHWLTFYSPARRWVARFKGVVPPFFAAVTLIFGLLAGFIAGDVWHRNTEAVQVVRTEGDALLTLKYLIPASDPNAARLQDLIRGYAQSVLDEEWPRMADGDSAPATEAALDSLLAAIVAAPPSQNGASAIERARIDTVLKVRTMRSNRLALAGDRTDEVKWATLLILGLVAQLAIAIVHLETPRPQIAALAIFSSSAVIALGLVAIQERPFVPPLELSPAPLQEVVRVIPAR